jgi:hypothetical protein
LESLVDPKTSGRFFIQRHKTRQTTIFKNNNDINDCSFKQQSDRERI